MSALINWFVFLKGGLPKKLCENGLGYGCAKGKHHTMETWIVRISPKNKISTSDWIRFEEESKTHRNVTWDKDFRNRIKKGDKIGFIVGEIGNENIHFYNIVGELATTSRSSHWSNDIYTHSQDIKHDISKREVIIIDTNTLKTYTYDFYKKSVGYKDKYMPRSTIKARPIS